ncbi:hypothetical protein NAEGRDRAFT_57790 [Naegleria gruberi]|uniref:Uncharacterized protein n=1 Tax=Naegleria gruberi TaxID=5762 RepID=D2VCE2_NAEGR|nr:uncharacterized protein NAEGRDRAFT_57790 [Naegleria gruberi]EFC45291.1 hypothetical protein NAEGRDRAFT_57790 [Naegleria gruberi]|eukprot:XP_002678035.1 hypothetical protein NAEGRDRAFT_57790 [Naegleria gruberi strain NEG-M]
MFYFNNMTESQKANMGKYEIRLMRMLSVNDGLSGIDFDFRTMISKLPRIFELTTGIEIPPEVKQVTQQDVSLANIGDYLKIVDIMVFKLSEHYQAETNNVHTQLIETSAKLILNGLRLAVLLKSGYDRSVIEEGALRITYNGESNFGLPIHTLPYMALASKFHLQIVKNIEQSLIKNNRDNILPDGQTGPVDYYVILEKDLNLLREMGLKYKRVQVYYGHLIEEMEMILRVKRSRTEVTIPLEENLGISSDESFLNIFKDVFGFNFDGFY